MLPHGPTIEFEHPQTLDVSVVIPVHKTHGLERAIESVRPQLKLGMELLVADHTGTGDALAACMMPEMERIVWAFLEPTGIMAGDWNRAIALARGRWIHLLHDDDTVEPNFYAYIAAGRGPNAGWATTGYRNVKDGAETFRRMDYPKPLWPALAVGNPFQPPAMMVARSTYEQFGVFAEEKQFHFCPDWEMWARLAEAGVPLHVCPQVLANWTEKSAGSNNLTPWHELFEDYRSLLEWFLYHGAPKEAVQAGIVQLLSPTLFLMLNAAIDGTDHSDLWQLALRLERQRRLCL